MPITGKSMIGLDFINYLRENYTGSPRNEFEKTIFEVSSLIEMSMDRRNALPKVLDKIAKSIQKTFEFRSVTIGIRQDDGYYRYVAIIGRTSEEEEAHRKLKFDLHDMIDYDKYPNVRLGRITQFHPVEAFPENEIGIKSFGKPELIDHPREKLDEFRQGDYIDFYMYGYEGKLIGWIEVSNIKDNKMPSRASIKWIELIAEITALAIQLRMHHPD